MNTNLILFTERLKLRPLALTDVDDYQWLLNDCDVASMTQSIPYPFDKDMAVHCITRFQERLKKGEAYEFAILNRDPEYLIGAIGLVIKLQKDNAEIGYWVGKQYWGNGYATEAARAVLKFGFEILNLNRIYGRHRGVNVASLRVMQKIGMTYEAGFRRETKSGSDVEDIEIYSILKDDFYV